MIADLGDKSLRIFDGNAESSALSPLGESDFWSDSNRTIGPQTSGRVARDGVFTSPSADGDE